MEIRPHWSIWESGYRMEAYVELQRWWNRTAVRVETTLVPESRILELEARYDVILPHDFRQYVRLSTPVGELWDKEMGTWWDFPRIKNIPEEFPRKLGGIVAERAHKYLFFLDHCIWSWAWAISCADDESNGTVAFIGGGEYDKIVADSFTDFVHKYINDWNTVAYT